MKNQEAKFILGAYRPDGRDAADPTFAEALAQAERDPELRAWLERERTFDAAVAAKLRAIAPPAALREAILAGARVSAAQTKRRWWTARHWVAAAAAVLVLVAIVSINLRHSTSRPAVAALAGWVLREIVDLHDEHVGFPPELADVQARLGSLQPPFTRHLTLDFDELRRKNCRSIEFGGSRLFELCFHRDGTWYHLYVGRRSDFAPGAIAPRTVVEYSGFAATVWADARQVYALVAEDAGDLRRLI